MSIYQWSQTAAANGSIDPTCPFPEGMAPSAVNDSMRGAMAAVAKYRDDISGSIVSSGTSSAYNISSNSVFTSYNNLAGMAVAFTAHTTNAGAVTLNVDSLATRPLRSSPGVELQPATLIQGTPYVAVYNNTDGVFYLQGFFGNPYNVPLGGMMEYTGFTPPNSAFVFPLGQALSRIAYPGYFALVGTGFGAGDGVNTFNIINPRGRVSVSADSGAGVMSGVNLNITGGNINSVVNIAQSQLPNVSPTFTGNNPGNGNLQSGFQLLSPSGFFNAQAGSNQLLAGVRNASDYFVTFPTPSGSISSINGGQAQLAMNIAMPYIGINKILRVI